MPDPQIYPNSEDGPRGRDDEPDLSSIDRAYRWWRYHAAVEGGVTFPNAYRAGYAEGRRAAEKQNLAESP